MILVDTSVWVEHFRLGTAFVLEDWAALDEIVTCLPVIQEVLQGFDDEQAYSAARDAMTAFPAVESPLTADLFDQAVGLYRTARRAGITVRSGVDCLIAACALNNRLAVLHRDRDFDGLAKVTPLEVQNITRAKSG